MLRNIIRKFLQKRGYDIVKMPKVGREYHGTSKYKDYTFHPTPIANYYLPQNVENDVIALHMKRGEFFEPEVISLAKRFIKPNTIVLDIGANFGQMSIEFAKTVGSEGFVYSFEAQKAVFDILSLNIQANNLNNVECVYGAVYKNTDKVFFFPPPDFTKFGSYGSFGLNVDNNEGVEVKSISVDSLQIDRPISFMKIDVQGSDLFALEGARETIMKNRMPILFEFEEQFQQKFSTNFNQYVEFVRSIDYEFAETIMDINFLILPK